MVEGIGKGLRELILFLIIAAILITLVIVGLIDWIFIDEAIKVTEPLTPELEITVKNNIIDTLYVYRKP